MKTTTSTRAPTSRESADNEVAALRAEITELRRASPRAQRQAREHRQLDHRRQLRALATELIALSPAPRAQRILDLDHRTLIELVGIMRLPDRVALCRGLR